ncbi:hypothetical protein D5086_029597 [Populus alba]|uniref:Uncharacterized protein n=1 Tax=Populus alba TaxID=43335 RepID=A0ACC4AUW5_POPAL
MIQPPNTVRKLLVEVVDARDLLPKDGQGSSSAYVIADFDGQRKRTLTKYRDLNPVWKETLEFIVSDPNNMEFEELEVEVLNDKKFGNGSGRKNHFLGRVKVYGSQFCKRGEEGIVYFPLEKKSLFSWIRGEIGLRICYYDELVEEDQQQAPPPSEKDADTLQHQKPLKSPAVIEEEGRVFEVLAKPEINCHDYHRPHFHRNGTHSPPFEVIEESPPPVVQVNSEPPLGSQQVSLPEEPHYVETHTQYHPEVRRMQTTRVASSGDNRVKTLRRPIGDFSPKVFALDHNSKTEGQFPNAAGNIEISVCDAHSEQFLGGVCFDISEVPVRDPPDSPLAPQWYRLESDAAAGQICNRVCGDIQLSDLHLSSNLPPLTVPEIRIKAQLGFQSARTRRGSMSNHCTSFRWIDDLIFVAGEPLEESLILLVEDRTTKEAVLLGHIIIPVSSIEQQYDERHVASKWFALEGGGGDTGGAGCATGGSYRGRIHLRARGLLPMKPKGGAKGSTDAYCVAKYGKKWVRTRTITDSFEPRWNEKYTWQPLLPKMHYLRPLGVAQQEALRGAATRMVSLWLARSEPPLGPEVVRYMLDADSHAWSMRKSKANWFRIVAVLAWAVGLAKWLDDIRRWRSSVTTVLVHILYLVLVWYPELVVPTGFLYVFLIGVWYYRFRPKIPAEGGKAAPAPPVGPALGSEGVNCKHYDFTVRTVMQELMVWIKVLKIPPASVLLLEAAGVCACIKSITN